MSLTNRSLGSLGSLVCRLSCLTEPHPWLSRRPPTTPAPARLGPSSFSSPRVLWARRLLADERQGVSALAVTPRTPILLRPRGRWRPRPRPWPVRPPQCDRSLGLARAPPRRAAEESATHRDVNAPPQRSLSRAASSPGAAGEDPPPEWESIYSFYWLVAEGCVAAVVLLLISFNIVQVRRRPTTPEGAGLRRTVRPRPCAKQGIARDMQPVVCEGAR